MQHQSLPKKCEETVCVHNFHLPPVTKHTHKYKNILQLKCQLSYISQLMSSKQEQALIATELGTFCMVSGTFSFSHRITKQPPLRSHTGKAVTFTITNYPAAHHAEVLSGCQASYMQSCPIASTDKWGLYSKMTTGKEYVLKCL